MKSENNSAEVDAFMKKLNHPLQDEIEAVRLIIKKANKKIAERVKWNTPSFFYTDDLATIHVKAQQHVLLRFHHPAIVKIKSALLEGDYKDRRMMYFTSMKEVITRKKELIKIVNGLIKIMGD